MVQIKQPRASSSSLPRKLPHSPRSDISRPAGRGKGNSKENRQFPLWSHNLAVAGIISTHILLAWSESPDHTQLQGMLGNVVSGSVAILPSNTGDSAQQVKGRMFDGGLEQCLPQYPLSSHINLLLFLVDKQLVLFFKCRIRCLVSPDDFSVTFEATVWFSTLIRKWGGLPHVEPYLHF